MHPNFDLNLVRIFLAIWDTRNLTVAGTRLGLTQPAISHALRRMRDQFDDPLFVRVGKSMVPTNAAHRLHEPLGRAYGMISHAVQEHGTFDPAMSGRRFRMAMSDVSEIYFLPRLLARFTTEAPNARIDVVPLDTEEVGMHLQLGEVDVAIGHLPEIEQECAGRHLLSDRLICLVRAGHPVIDKGLDLASFPTLRHIHAGTSAPGHQMIDLRLSDAGMHRIIALSVARLTTAPDILRDTDLAVIYPESLATKLNNDGCFALLEIPIPLPAIDVKAHVHPKFGGDPGIKWLLELVVDLFAGAG